MAPLILHLHLALHHGLYPALLHSALPHLAGMVSVLATVIFYLALGCRMFNKNLWTSIICVFVCLSS
jgi:hypothetical protein